MGNLRPPSCRKFPLRLFDEVSTSQLSRYYLPMHDVHKACRATYRGYLPTTRLPSFHGNTQSTTLASQPGKWIAGRLTMQVILSTMRPS